METFSVKKSLQKVDISFNMVSKSIEAKYILQQILIPECHSSILSFEYFGIRGMLKTYPIQCRIHYTIILPWVTERVELLINRLLGN